MRRITQKDIANLLGIHVRTITRVLRNDPAVSSAMRLRVIRELNRHGYFIRPLDASAPLVIDVPSASGYRLNIVSRLLENIAKCNFTVQISDHRNRYQEFKKIIRDAGTVFFCSTPGRDVLAETHEINPGAFRINMFASGIYDAEISLEPDHSSIGKIAAKYLGERYRRVLLIGSPESIACHERIKSFTGEMFFTHPECEVRYLLRGPDENFVPFFSEYFRKKEFVPGAVFCTTGSLCIEMQKVLKKISGEPPFLLGVDSPDDLELQINSVSWRIDHLVDLAAYYICSRPLFRDGLKVRSSPQVELKLIKK